MAMTVGTRLGMYDVGGQLGAGGMGEVYRARDTRLQRDVAIKILPEAFASDPARLARFEREAQVLAALNPPNIAQIRSRLDASGQPCRVASPGAELVRGAQTASAAEVTRQTEDAVNMVLTPIRYGHPTWVPVA